MTDDTRTSPTLPLPALHVPTTIGKYRITEYLGRGGMGVVVSADDVELQRAVALKLIAPGAWGDAASVRIEREAKAMAKLAHPNVVTVYEVRREGEHPFIAMELVTGVTLRDWLRAEKRSWREILAMVIAAGRGLAAAHAAGLVHRDFKPENVLVGADGRPRVSDFGLVATTVIAAEAGDAQDGSSIVAGTPAYMAPEQWDGRDVDARADQFAFGVTCWEALFGQRPFASREMREVSRVRSRRGVPRRVEAVLRRAILADREARWGTLAEMLERLERAGRDRRPLIVAAVVVGVALTIAGVAFARSRNAESLANVCRAAGDDVTSVWNSERQRALAAAFAARPEPFARDAWADVQRSIDDWTADYRGVRIQTCQTRRSAATGTAQLASARDGCLDRRRDELGALLTGLAQPDATTVRYARAAARGLARPISCLSVQSDAPSPSDAPLSAREALSGLQSRLVASSTQRALGKPRDAVALAEGAAREAEAIGWAPLIAESQLELGLAYQAANQNADGEKAHARAALFADAAQDDEVRFAAMLGLADAGMDHSEYDKAGQAIERARMIARRLPPDERRDVTIDLHEALLSFWRGDYRQCIDLSAATLARIEKVLGASAIEGLILREKHAHCLNKLDRHQEGKAVSDEALAIADRTTGREHPVVADVLFMQAYELASLGQVEESIAIFRDALGIRERVLGLDNPIVGISLTGLANALVRVGEFREARVHLERARTIIAPTWGSDSPALAIVEHILGDIAMELGEHDAAVDHYRASLAIRVAKRPPGHDERSMTMGYLGRALLAKGDREALEMLRDAVTAFDASPSRHLAYVEQFRLDLGRALVAFGDARKGRAAIKASCEVIETTPELASLLEVCRQSLR